MTVVLPLVALILGASAIGDELEDGTAVYQLTEPIPRWQIMAPKLVASWLATTALVLPPAVVAGLIALDGEDTALVTGFGIAIAASALAYTAVFVLLSVITSRALIRASSPPSSGRARLRRSFPARATSASGTTAWASPTGWRTRRNG